MYFMVNNSSYIIIIYAGHVGWLSAHHLQSNLKSQQQRADYVFVMPCILHVIKSESTSTISREIN